MNKDIAIKVENLSKKYIIGEKNSYVTLRDQIINLPKKLFTHHKPKEFWALNDISFEIKKGEIIGVIGQNGAGKSTLLKVLSRIVEPTKGKITMRGRVASLLEVGTGFNPELTGRENIYLNGAIIGMSRKEIKQKFESIVSFSGIGVFLDTPVKRYSSGMYVRLAFAVAAHLDSDILLVDEVLAVGDVEFQKKCLGKMNELASDGRTVVLVSHNMSSIQNLCTKTIWLSDGSLKCYASTKNAVKQYLHYSTNNASGINARSFIGPLRQKITYNKISVNTYTGKLAILSPKDQIEVIVEGVNHEEQSVFYNTMIIYKEGIKVATFQDTLKPTALLQGKFTANYTISPYVLRPGEYTINLLGQNDNHHAWILAEDVAAFSITSEWSKKNQEINDGIVNIPFSSSRDQNN